MADYNLQALGEFVSKSTYTEISEHRKDLNRQLDGEIFFQLKLWSKNIQRSFWKKPMSDQECFKLCCFFWGNGLHPEIFMTWILSSYFWRKEDIKKRVMQLASFMNNVEKRKNRWFHYDICNGRYEYLNGNSRRWSERPTTSKTGSYKSHQIRQKSWSVKWAIQYIERISIYVYLKYVYNKNHVYFQ